MPAVSEAENANLARHYAPRSIADMETKGGVFRDTDFHNSLFREVLSELGEAHFLELVGMGNQELSQRATLHQKLYQAIRDDIHQVLDGIPVRGYIPEHDQYPNIARADIDRATTAYEGLRTPDDEPFAWSQVIQDMALFPQDSRPTIRRALEARKKVLVALRGQSMSEDEQEKLDAPDVSYMRGNIWREPFTVKYAESLLEYYGLGKENRNRVFFTNHGLSAPKLALETLTRAYPESSLMLFGSPYWETYKYINSEITDRNKRVKLIQKADDTEAIIENIIGSGQTGKPTIAFMEPISSYPQMRVTDVEKILNTAKQQYSGDVPFFLIMDISTLGNGISLLGKLNNIVEGSNVNIILTQSLQKSHTWGMDIAHLGMVTGIGRLMKDNDMLEKKMREIYYLRGYEPDIPSVLYMPPVIPEYLQFRAKMVERNARLISSHCQEIAQEKQGMEVFYPGLKPQDSFKTTFIGYEGSYLFLKMPTAVLERFLDLLKSHQDKDQLGYIEQGVSFGHDYLRLQRIKGTNTIRIVPGTQDICSTYFTALNLKRLIREAYGLSDMGIVREKAVAQVVTQMQEAIISENDTAINHAREAYATLIRDELARVSGSVVSERFLSVVHGKESTEGLACVTAISDLPDICGRLANAVDSEIAAVYAFDSMKKRISQNNQSEKVAIDGYDFGNFPLNLLKHPHLSVRSAVWSRLNQLLDQRFESVLRSGNGIDPERWHILKKIFSQIHFGDDETVFQMTGNLEADYKFYQILMKTQMEILRKISEYPKADFKEYTVILGTTGSPFGLHHREALKTAVEAVEESYPGSFVEGHIHLDDNSSSKAKDHLAGKIPSLRQRKILASLQVASDPQLAVATPAVPILFDNWNQNLAQQMMHEIPVNAQVFRLIGADHVLNFWRKPFDPNPYLNIQHVVNLRECSQEEIARVFESQGYAKPILFRKDGIVSSGSSTRLRQDLRETQKPEGLIPEALGYLSHYGISFDY